MSQMEDQSLRIMKSQSYAQGRCQDLKHASPVKASTPFAAQTSPDKENSPLKTFGALRKQSMKAGQENSQSPVKMFGSSSGSKSPQKKSSRRILK